MSSTANSSWRTIGGTQSYQQLNSINANYISTDTFNMRSAYEGLFKINGFLKVDGDVFFYQDEYVSGDITIYGNTYLQEFLYLGHDNAFYFYGTNNGIGLNTVSPVATLDIQGNTALSLNIHTTVSDTENYLATNSALNTVGIGTTAATAFVRFYDSGDMTTANSSLLSTAGNLYIDTLKTTIFQSRVLVAPAADNPQHLNLENLTIYDTPTQIFDYALYGNLLSYSGTSITGIASEDRSTTFLTLNTKNLQGVGLGGGVYQNYAIGVLGTYDVCGQFSVAQTVLSAEVKPITKKISVGINTIAPEYGNYIMDINGPLRIRMAEINNMIVATFEFKTVVFCAADGNYGVAIGAPSDASGSAFTQYVLYTTDGGLTWAYSRVDETTDLELTVNYFYAAYYESVDYVVIAGNGNYMYYSTDGGATWTQYTYSLDYIDFVAEDSVQPITTAGLWSSGGVVFGGYYNETAEYSAERGFYSYYVDASGDGIRQKINVFGNSDLSFVCAVGSGDVVYFLANSDASGGAYLFEATFDFDTYNFTYSSTVSDLCYNFFSGKTLQFHYLSDYGEFLFGTHILYKDSMSRWNESDYSVPSGVVLYHAEFLDADRGVAVGTGGTFIYTTDGGVNWAIFPQEILNSYGNASLLVDAGIDLLNIHSYDETTFIISYSSAAYSYGSTVGESKIYHCYVPTMFQRSNTFVMDICGSVRITGDFNVGDSDSNSHFWGDMYVDGFIDTETGVYVRGEKNSDYFVSIGSIDSPATQISRATLKLQGQNGNEDYNTWSFKVGTIEATTSTYDTKRLRITDETEGSERMTIDQNGYVGIGTTAPVSLLEVAGVATVSDTTEAVDASSGALQVYGGAGIKKDVYIAGITHAENYTVATKSDTGALQVLGGAGVGGSVFVGGNITVEDTTVARSVGTGALLVRGGAGVGGSVYVGGNITIEDDTKALSVGTGALLVSGGAGVGGSVYVGGNITVIDDTAALSVGTGALIVDGGAGVGGSVYVGGNITILGGTACEGVGTGALIVDGGGAWIGGNVFVGQEQYVFQNQEVYGAQRVIGSITTETGIYIQNPASYTENFLTVGTIDEPEYKISQGTMTLQGQNGDGAYNSWSFSVGTTSAATGTYETTRLRLVDGAAGERLTVDMYGYVGIGTAEPVSLLEVAGVATVSDTTNAVDASSGALLVYGGAGIKKDVYIAGITHAENTAVATSSTTGALLVVGGAGVGGSVFVGGNITIEDETAARGVGTGALLVAGGAGVGGSVYVGGNITVEDTTTALGVGTGALLVAGGAGVGGSVFVGGNITVVDDTTALSVGTGALLVSGGAGVGGSVYVGGNITILDGTASEGVGTGALLVSGGAWIGGNVFVGQEQYVFQNQEVYGAQRVIGAITTETAVYIQNPASYTENILVIGTIDEPEYKISQGRLTLQGKNGDGAYNSWNFAVGTTSAATGTYETTRLRIIDDTTGSERMTIDTYGYVGIGTTEPVSLLDVAGVATVSDTTNAVDASSGALQVLGGAGIQKDVYVAGIIYAENSAEATSTGTGALLVSSGGVGVSGSVYVGGNITIRNDTAARSAGTGALLVDGGVGVGGSVYVGGNITVRNETTSVSANTGALLVDGGVGVGGSVYVGGNITIRNETVSVSAGTGALLVDGGVGVGGSVFVGGNITVLDETAATSAGTGALLVRGGVGVSGNVYIAQNNTVLGAITTETALYIENPASYTENILSVGTIDDPYYKISQGRLTLQGQNGDGAYNSWNFAVGTTSAATGTYDATRLRIIDDTTGAERMTVDMYGYVGIGTTAPVSMLEVAGVATVSDTTEAVDASSGAFLVYGGAAIQKDMYVAGIIHAENSASATSVGTGALLVSSGGVGVAGSVYVGGNITVVDDTAARGVGTGALLVAGGVGVSGSVYVGGNITVVDDTAARGVGTGALLVAGGAGVSGSVFVGGNITIEDDTAARGVGTGALLVAGGAGVSGSVFVGGNITIVDTTACVGVGTGALLVAGGVGIAGDVVIGNILYVEKDQYITSKLTVAGSVEITGDDSYKDYIETIGSISNPLQKISQGTLALQGQNGAGNYTTWKIQCGTTNPGTSSYDTTRLRVVDDTDSGGERLTIDTNGYVGIGTTAPVSLLEVAGVVSVSDTTTATSATTGALVVSGGVGVSGASVFGSTVSVLGVASFSAEVDCATDLVVSGNIWAAEIVAPKLVAGNVAVSGAVAVSGSISVATDVEVAGNVVVSSTANLSEVVIAGNIVVSNTTDATDTTTAALVVAGGAAVAGNVVVGGKITLDEIYVSDIYVNGGTWETATSGSDYTISVGSIVNPASMYSQGTVLLQGQNGMENYSIWTMSVGATVAGTSSYDTTRFRITDYNQDEERLTIDMNGYVGIGTSEPTTMLDVAGEGTFSGAVSAASYSTTSDYRIKEDVRYLEENEEYYTENLRPAEYYNMMTQSHELGFIAHEVGEIYPFMVQGEMNGEQYQRLNYTQIIAALVHDIKLLRHELSEFKCRVL